MSRRLEAGTTKKNGTYACEENAGVFGVGTFVRHALEYRISAEGNEDSHILGLKRLYSGPSLSATRPNPINSAATKGVGARTRTMALDVAARKRTECYNV
ncbi:hypothetical protein TRAPUB_4480 [Trametes pubescens]|uniref:Uncharacterized protein n=1 Tax=Trametes pubescens TaxID=154538 RepID=A0A1M2VAV1_TRAPU|nr:hypothetical protein TRAPUB_4480 [Trametes pubescens]